MTESSAQRCVSNTTSGHEGTLTAGGCSTSATAAVSCLAVAVRVADVPGNWAAVHTSRW